MKWFPLLVLAYVFGETKTLSNTCRRELTYDQNYGYGYLIHCNTLNLEEFNTLTVFNELGLTIVNSDVNLNSTFFKNLARLRYLNVTYSKVDFEPGSLKLLTNLHKLSLAYDELTELHGEILSGLGKLSEINLKYNNLSRFSNGSFKGLNVKVIGLEHNKIKDVDALNLCDLKKLRTLLLNNNYINTVSKDSIGCLKNLLRLDLAYNQIKSFDTNIPDSVTDLRLSYNLIEFVNYINATNLQFLDLEGNQITKVEASSFMELQSLTSLSLKNNKISYVDPLAFQYNNKLKHLSLEMNKLFWIDCRVPSLEDIILSQNLIHEVHQQNFTHLTSAKVIDLTNNSIHSIDQDSFSTIHSLDILILNNNKLTELNLKFFPNSLMTELYVANNNITVLSDNTFKNLPRLETLDISSNQLKELNDTVFHSLKNLEVLNISYNKMTNLDYEILDPLENLRVLDIEGNNLENIDYSLIINELPSLDEINIKNNLLSCEFLIKMIRFFKENGINFTVNENFSYKENVGGIYCKETEKKVLQLQEANAVMLNNSKILSELYQLSKNKSDGKYKTYGVLLLVMVLVFCTGLSIAYAYKYHQWTKRKNYMVDELELISNEGFKILT